MVRKTLLLFLILCLPYTAWSQGCSDAGVCTINSFKPRISDSLSTVNHHQVKAGLSYGSADHSIYVLASYLAYDQIINDKFSFDFKVTTLSQTGNEITSTGFSDIYLNGNFNATQSTGITLGVKIPLSDGGKSLNGLPLPMDYQSSLGTFDLIIGLTQSIKKLQLVLALQQPLTQNNNAFLAELYPEDSPLSSFQSTNEYIRSGDILLRISYPFMLGKKFILTPSLLSIYHLENDKYTNIEFVETTIEGSRGLTVNANFYLDYMINASNQLNLSLGFPLVVREARPDGLTRKFVVNLEYAFKF